MERVVIVPVGVTPDTVRGALSHIERPDAIIGVTVPGKEGDKYNVTDVLRDAATVLGAKFYYYVIGDNEAETFGEVYQLLSLLKPRVVYLVGYTGSRYLYPPLFSLLLKYWRDTGADILILRSIEGASDVKVEKLPAYFYVAMTMTAVQKRILCLVYSENVSAKDLITKYGFTRSVYKVLSELERRGLLQVKRGVIEKTTPGMLIYNLLRGECDESG